MNVPIRHPGSAVGHPVDAQRWPDVASVPAGPTARVRSAAAAALFRRATRDLGIRVEYPDGTLGGADTDGVLPRMIVRRPDDFWRRLGSGGLIGFGEAFMAGDWTTDDLVGVLTPFATRAARLVPATFQPLRSLVLPKQPAAEENTPTGTRTNIARHYDLSNAMFATFLDETMTYSSAVFDDVSAPARWADLADAQRRKIDRLLDLAGVGPGTRLLEIGTGWGELCIRAAARGADVYSVTLSTEQRDLARDRVARAGYADAVRIDLLDYRAIEGTFDAVVSVEMIEAVGDKYWPAYFSTIDRLLAPGGRVAIQAITMPHERMVASRNTYTWIHKYIFPGGQLTSVPGLRAAVRRHTSLRMTGGTALGVHYAETLRLWRERFLAADDEVAALGFDHTFARMWQFYLAYSEAGFRAGYLDVYQFVFAREES
ncbi:Cyclopropane-fatty-acyl-phospholipid synthase [Gordonia bronchialis DSM 43247]|uniref:Cyclopropane-fatty-acyl-phospholipid synthase n=1 Tax=Gordonia bronchialis (strain ATCC 25592 / DSM 43247 / BCRC 13721 / JCM 3198 / KCTC 3076 / NBRC 16047 / NCTC 10667) TaxID=526226 RepID=D0LAC2_GORB4|nr:cyclopropane-fatty-acyl-phospholipid synthase family protein [Gordonia bronchialis]ACY19451.1 Cyclopropane-fatty-acyl-phospholipid synthase [Gordonia bronchialis DSM 43247]MCC3322231.1 cyclopropane-fatty-acyl-phospholipid synthase family protein [Gordonia bronchialis]QGS26613.1 methyltransferase domain-containing protein [Gordonia bronchialis]UAK37012.1 cyclopropane-fatty-acyl-phospholipid synthase family protein [Gordonia bronchialis]STQ62206.1 Cyclopropane-fatty-acyl-phospholipid synthase